MPTEETPKEHGGQDFVAPDESRRINDPERAESIARGVDALLGVDSTRGEAARFRKQAAKATELGDNERAEKLYRDAKTYDRMAEKQEHGVGIHLDAKELAESLEEPELSNTIRKVIEDYRQVYQESEELRQTRGDEEKIGAAMAVNKARSQVLATQYVALRTRQEILEGKKPTPLPWKNFTMQLHKLIGAKEY